MTRLEPAPTVLEELPTVEETKHLVPNLKLMVEAVFGKGACFLDWKRSHLDRAAGERKHPDGLVWLPWREQVWVVEVEWKTGSNFFRVHPTQECAGLRPGIFEA